MAETEPTSQAKAKAKARTVYKSGGPLGGVFFVAFIGAAVYFIQQAAGFWGIIWALIKAAVWPGLVVYKVLSLLHL